MIVDYLEQRDLLPAFREGMNNIAADEQRHIGFGVKLLADLRREDDRVPHAVAALLREVLPYSGQVLMPPNWDERYLSCFGYTIDRVSIEGLQSLTTKLRSAGLAIDSLPGPRVLPVQMGTEELAVRGVQLSKAGILGVREGPSARDPETVEMLFDTMRLSVDPTALRRPAVFQWEFTDADVSDWHIIVDNGNTRAERGRASRADVRMRVSYQDWVDIVGDRLDRRRALLSRRLRPHGSPLGLLKMARAFPQ
jgi:hypothetical protein